MNEIKQFLTSYYGYMVIGLIASIVSYAKKVREGHLRFSWLDALAHMGTSLVFAFMLGNAAYVLGYQSVNEIVLAAWMGAYLGDNTVEVFYKIFKIERRKK